MKGSDGERLDFETTNPFAHARWTYHRRVHPQGYSARTGRADADMVVPEQRTRFVFLPVFAFGVMFTIWWYKGKDPTQVCRLRRCTNRPRA